MLNWSPFAETLGIGATGIFFRFIFFVLFCCFGFFKLVPNGCPFKVSVIALLCSTFTFAI